LIGLENVDLVFLTAIVGVAVWQGLGPSLLASILSSLSYNYFFLPPIYTFTISDPTNVAAFVIFALLSVVISNLAARGRIYSVAAQERVRSVEQLHAFSRKLASAGTLDDVLWATVYQIASMLRVNVVLLLPEDGTIALKAGYPPEDHLEAADLAAATWAWEKERPAGRDSDTLPGAEWLFIPMRTSRGLIGILGITREAQGPLVRADQRRLLDALADQGALAIERAQLVGRVEQDRRTAETEQLRTALLTSISHDLKTPLASILGSAGTLRDLSGKLDENEKQELTETIIEESERLNRFIANLLDMTKLESGAVAPNLAAYEVSEIIGTALSRASKIMAAHTLEVEIGNGNPTVLVDPVLLEQALFNLLDNAAKYSERGTKIRIQSWRDNEWIQIQVLDEGPGIPSDELTYIFDKFYRVRKSDSVRAGTGLGLAISKGFIEGMHGRIVAANRTDRPGAIFSIMLPAQEPNDQELTP
jgi:two-component system sensor histidine kinase KdpD